MASIPNLLEKRPPRRGPGLGGRLRLQRGGRAIPENDDLGNLTEEELEASRDRVVQQTDGDASNSRLSAVALKYLDDPFAEALFPSPTSGGGEAQPPPRRYPIINRGTYVRTTAIDRLVRLFLTETPTERKQVVSLGAGSDTRFFRFYGPDHPSAPPLSPVTYHELDFEANVAQKRTAIRHSTALTTSLQKAADAGSTYHLHALDLRALTKESPPAIPDLDPSLPTLLISECCLCYLPPDIASSVLQYFFLTLRSAQTAVILYEPIRPRDAFGQTMVTNLASRGIHLQTLKRYGTLEAQRQRLKVAGFAGGQGARDVLRLWEEWVAGEERARVEGLEWLDEVEEWRLLAGHYCVAWGWTGDVFANAWRGVEGDRTPGEEKDDAGYE